MQQAEGERRSRRQVRPPELSTLSVAALLLLTSWLPDAAPSQDRDALRLTAGLLVAFALFWYHGLPQERWVHVRFLIGGPVTQLVAAYLLAATGGVASPYFPYFLLTPLSAVFSYRTTAAAVMGSVALLSFAAIWIAAAARGLAEGSAGVGATRLIALGATVLLAILLTRTMTQRRAALAERTRQLATAMEEVRWLAVTDPLTGLYNRRFLDEQLRIAEPLVARSASRHAVLAIDVDGMKALNDLYGHRAGDEALLRVADALRSLTRGSDVAARVGGDEFVVLLPQTDEGQARTLAQRLCRAAQDPAAGAGRPVSVSVGVAPWRPGASCDEVLDAADADLYTAKRSATAASAAR